MRGAILAGMVFTLVAAMPGTAFGSHHVAPWDGTNPFKCDIQYLGEGSTPQHPQIDPFCVDYDKTHQDISELGIVKFLVKEPARVSNAMNKCWYFQQDHWTGQIIAGDDSTETYHWDGTYFFDKRFGYGGVHVEHFTINHQTADPSQLPGFPAAWKPYFGPGRGGVLFKGEVNVNPACLPHGGPGHSPYLGSPGSYNGGSTSPARPRLACPRLGGAAHRGLGRAHLGFTRKRTVRALGRPIRRRYGFLHFCVRSGGDLAVHFGHRGRADFVVTTSKAFHAGRARVGSTLRAARHALRGERLLARKGRGALLGVSHRGWRLLVGARRGRVTFLVVASSSLSARRLGGLLIASGG